MKKIFLGMILVLLVILTSGCGNGELSIYEKHIYNQEKLRMEHTIAKYDSRGKLKYLELTMVYDKETETTCPTDDFPDTKFKDVVFDCKKNDDGTVKIVTSLTDKSISDGYIKNTTNRLTIKYEYNTAKSESKLKESFENQAYTLKENGKCDNKNYFVIEGKRTC